MKKLSVIRESLFSEELNEGTKCTLCQRYCVLKDLEVGFCKCRVNRKGKIYTLVYGDISALEVRPIEIKPFFHFYPGSLSLTFSTWSCNFVCPWCQNWRLSKGAPDPRRANYISAEEMVKKAINLKVKGLCVSFQEPTLLSDYCLELFPLAKEKGLYNTFVSNGYMSPKTLKSLKDAGLDAINIDMKGNEKVYKKYCGGVNVKGVWDIIEYAKELDIHVEVVNLIIPGVNDSEKDISYVIENLIKTAGRDTPLHFTRYFPAFRFNAPFTPTSTLERAYDMAKEKGILYPYVGNVPFHPYENTYCPSCGELLIERKSYKIVKYKIKNKKCPLCGESIKLIDF